MALFKHVPGSTTPHTLLLDVDGAALDLTAYTIEPVLWGPEGGYVTFAGTLTKEANQTTTGKGKVILDPVATDMPYPTGRSGKQLYEFRIKVTVTATSEVEYWPTGAAAQIEVWRT